MSHLRLLSSLTFAAVVGAALAQPAAARTRHHRHHPTVYVDREPSVTTTPAHPDAEREAGFFGGYMVTGILGAATADPYNDPGYSRGHYGLPLIPDHY